MNKLYSSLIEQNHHKNIRKYIEERKFLRILQANREVVNSSHSSELSKYFYIVSKI